MMYLEGESVTEKYCGADVLVSNDSLLLTLHLSPSISTSPTILPSFRQHV